MSSNKILIFNQFKIFLKSKINSKLESEKVLIDFSSPNIAKPFHPGHLRATLLGNFVSNVNQVFGHEIHRINYLGDWGTQFGYLLHGLEVFEDKSQSEEMTMKYLYDIYVKSYKSFGNDDYLPLIKDITSRMEKGDEDLLNKWSRLKSCSLDNLKEAYQRLGIKFDSFEFESDYVKSSKEMVEKLQMTNKAVSLCDGALSYAIDNNNKVILLTSQGSSLYITRDIAAAISRFDRHKPDRIHYVVENSQTLHFERLKRILEDLNYDVGDKSDNLVPTDFHIKFGRVNKMSTRAGNVIFLDHILDHAKSLMMEKLKNEGKVSLTLEKDFDKTCDDLGKTLIFCEFLRPPRRNSFDFLWNRDNLGFRLQYCAVRLNSLEMRCAERSIFPNLSDCFNIESYESFKVFKSGYELVEHIHRFQEVLTRCYLESESCYLMQYISKMSGLVNNSLKEVNVINCSNKMEAEGRLKLFSVSKFIFNLSFQILGLPVLDKI